MANAESSIEGKSSSEMKEMLAEQTKAMVEPESIEHPAVASMTSTDEAVEFAKQALEESTPKETPKEETTGETPKEETKDELHKIKVEGKEEAVPYEKLVEYAQKGRYLEKEIAKLKKQREEVGKTTNVSTPELGPSLEKMNEQFVENLSKNPLGTLDALWNIRRENERIQEAKERSAEKEFELEQKGSLPHWEVIKPLYKEFRELGYDREKALLAAEGDFFKTLYVKARQDGVTDGEKKAKAKLSADIPSGGKKVKPATSTELPSDEELAKLPSDQIGKFLRKVRNPDW